MLYDSSLWCLDIDLVMGYLPELDELAGSSILITGVNGLVCSAVADVLIRYNETHNRKISILAAGRVEHRVKDRFAEYSNRSYFSFVPYDATSPMINFSVAPDFIIHGASNASPNIFVKEPVETITGNFTGLLTLLNYGKQFGLKRLLYVSSSEVYGKKNRYPYQEDSYGVVDILNLRNSYAMGKRVAETLCAAYTEEYSLDTVIVRPGHIYGPTALETDRRVASAWSYAVVKGEDIVLKSSGEQIRSYCYCLDCASAIIKVLIKGKSACAYNISNPSSIISIKELAELLVKFGNVSLRMEQPTELEKSIFNPMDNSSLDSSRLQALGWDGLFDATTGIEHTVQILKDRLRG